MNYLCQFCNSIIFNKDYEGWIPCSNRNCRYQIYQQFGFGVKKITAIDYTLNQYGFYCWYNLPGDLGKIECVSNGQDKIILLESSIEEFGPKVKQFIKMISFL